MRPILCRPILSGQIPGSVDQTDVRKRLREIADQSSGGDVVALRKQPDVPSNGQKAVEDRSGLFVSPLKLQVVRQPERAQQEAAFAVRKTVHVRIRPVTLNEPV